MRDLIFISMEDWDDVWRRNQFVVAELARRHPDAKILFVGTQRNAVRHLKAGRVKGLLADPTWVVPEFRNVTVTRPLRVGPERFDWGLAVNRRLTRRHVNGLSTRLGMDRPVLWLNPHYGLHLVGSCGESAVIYDITDDWTVSGQDPRVLDHTRREDAALCSRADATIVCSRRLYDLKTPLVPDGRLHLIPNGVDAAHYAQVLNDLSPLPVETADWQRPVFGYVGTAHADRLDVDLLEKMARQMTAGTIVLVGPDMLGEVDRSRLRVAGRVKFTGAVPYARVPQFMRAFDVCITPHRVTPFTESLNPIKLWEYLAAGKPIVSTPVAGFRDYPQHVRLAADPSAFLAACYDALAVGEASAQVRRDEARRHSWGARVDAVEAVLRRVTGVPELVAELRKAQRETHDGRAMALPAN